MNLKVWWRGLAEGRCSGFTLLLTTLLLAVPSLLYGLLLQVRALLYRYGIFKSSRLSCPIISVGNLTVGGTGKTPITIWIARYLLQQGLRVAVLSRGYGGTLQGGVAVVSDGRSIFLSPDICGDEPCLMAHTLPELMVVVGANRYQAGLLALEQLQPDVLLLDDGFQHLRLQRDLNILLLDSSRPFGNGWTLPLGLLREPRSALRRADLVVFTRHQPGQQVVDPGVPYCWSSHQLTTFRRLVGRSELPVAGLQQARVAAFCGIADPHAFFEGLQGLGITLVATLALPDHEPYGGEGLRRLECFATACNADWLVTTEKDGVKLALQQQLWLNKVVTVRLELQVSDNGRLVKAALEKLLAPHP